MMQEIEVRAMHMQGTCLRNISGPRNCYFETHKHIQTSRINSQRDNIESKTLTLDTASGNCDSDTNPKYHIWSPVHQKGCP